MKRVSIFVSLPSGEKLLFTEALIFLFLARLMLIFLPFRICIRTIRWNKTGKEPEKEQIKAIKKAIERAGRLAFWKNVCLGKSFAARWMLQRRGITSALMIGVRHDEQKKLQAHAWLTVGELEIVPKMDNYNIITTF